MCEKWHQNVAYVTFNVFIFILTAHIWDLDCEFSLVDNTEHGSLICSSLFIKSLWKPVNSKPISQVSCFTHFYTHA